MLPICKKMFFQDFYLNCTRTPPCHLYLMGQMLVYHHAINTQVCWEVVRKYWVIHILLLGWVRMETIMEVWQKTITICWSLWQSTSPGCIQAGEWGSTTTSQRRIRCFPTCVTSTATIPMWTLVIWGSILQRGIFRGNIQLEWCGDFWYCS